jgi:hypothetical protein
MSYFFADDAGAVPQSLTPEYQQPAFSTNLCEQFVDYPITLQPILREI